MSVLGDTLRSGNWLFRGLLLLLAPVCLVLGLLAPAGAATPALLSTNPVASFWQTNGRVQAILATRYAVYIGGTFTELLGPNGQRVAVHNMAALNPTTGAPLPGFHSPGVHFRSPTLTPQVWDFALCGGRLYTVGDFGYSGTVRRLRAAAFSATTGARLKWNPRANGRVYTVTCTSSMVYLGGKFSTLGGKPHNHLGAVGPVVGALQARWPATANDQVRATELSPAHTRLIVGGLFTAISGHTQLHIAALSPATGARLSWANTTRYAIDDLTISNGQIFAGGPNHSGSVQAWTLGGSQQWATFGNGNVQTLREINGVLYVGGHFSTWSGLTAHHLVAMNPANGAVLSWPVRPNSALGVWAVARRQGVLYVGGDFTKINGKLCQHLAVFD